MRSIAELKNKPLGQLLGMYITEAWYFEKWYEKLILIGLGILGMWKIFGWIY
jgi:hypothetical protein